MSARAYRILDEPLPGGLQRVAVNPLWPLLAVMFAGSLFSWSWFVLNGFAVGSPTRRREFLLAIIGLTGSAVLVFVVLWLSANEVLERAPLRYVVVVVTVWKLAMSYWLYTLQSRCFGLYEHFGGPVRNGVLPLVGAAIASPLLLGQLPSVLQIWLR